MDPFDLFALFTDPDLIDSHRAIRMRLGHRLGPITQMLMVQRGDIIESMFEGTTGYLTCLSRTDMLRREDLIGQPIEVQLVTDQGNLQSFAGIVTEVLTGMSDGSLATYQLVMRDALQVLRHRTRTRIFKDRSPPQIITQVLRELHGTSPALAAAFDFQLLIEEARYPSRAMTVQYDESDSRFLRRLMRRAGISWFSRACPDTGELPRHQLVLFDDNYRLPVYAGGALRCHHGYLPGQRDAIDQWAPLLTLGSGSVLRTSYDYKGPNVYFENVAGRLGLGAAGAEVVAALKDSRIDVPHVGDDWAHHQRLAELDMQRHESKAACVHGSGSVRDLPFGGSATVTGLPELDSLSNVDREYVFIRVEHHAQNNLPKPLEERANALLTANRRRAGIDGSSGGWYFPDHLPVAHGGYGGADAGGAMGGRDLERDPERYRNFFIACKRSVPIVPAWNPRKHLPTTHVMTAVVVGNPGEVVWCDAQARVRVKLLGLDPEDHPNGEDVTACLRVDHHWAGQGFGILFPLRAGMEVYVGFVNGDPDKPFIMGSAHNGRNVATRLSPADTPDINPTQSGIVTQQFHGLLQNRLRFDDHPVSFNVQLGSGFATSQVNLGALAHDTVNGRAEPRGEGAELTSEAAAAVRGGQGVYVAAGQEGGAKGPMLQRDGMLSLSKALLDVVNHLAGLGESHNAGTVDPERLQQLVTYLHDWHKGTNVAPDESGGGAPLLAMNAQAGAGLVSQDNLLLGAQTNIDAVSVRNVQVTAGQQIHHRASNGISQFTDTGELRQTVGKGLMIFEVHDGDLHINIAGQIVLNGGGGVVINGPTVKVVATGAQTNWGNGTIEEQARGVFQIKSASFSHTGGGDGSPETLKLPATTTAFDQQFLMTWTNSGEPMVDEPYRLVTEDGQIVEGRTDANGMTQRVSVPLNFGGCRIEHLRPSGDTAL